MIFAEVIYETGNKAICCYADKEEAQRALAEHQRRAINGEPGTGESALRLDLAAGESRIGSWVAERIKKVLLYDEHPATFGEDQLVDTAAVKKVVDAAIKESELQGVVHVHTIAAAVRDMSNPLVAEPTAHESQYKMDATSELDLAFLKAVE